MGVNTFISGLACDLDLRCERLLTLLEEHSPHHDTIHFWRKTINHLKQTRKEIKQLQQSGWLNHEPSWRMALFEYQELIRLVALVEQGAIPILLRYNKKDHQCTQLVKAIGCNIGYPPGLLPLASSTSDQYYWTLPELQIVGMPAGDIEGVLGWPDLIHELVHPLLLEWPNFLSEFTPSVQTYYRDQRDMLTDIGGSEGNNQWLAIGQMKWSDKRSGTWRVELACDLLATFFVGPSYGWQHIRLSVNHGQDPYSPSPGETISGNQHPADQARLDGIVAMLDILGLEKDAEAINNRWLDVIAVSNHGQPPQGYNLYYPPELIYDLAQIVQKKAEQHGLIPFTKQQNLPGNIIYMIDQAWKIFTQEPEQYPKWEREVIKSFHDQFICHPDVHESKTSNEAVS